MTCVFLFYFFPSIYIFFFKGPQDCEPWFIFRFLFPLNVISVSNCRVNHWRLSSAKPLLGEFANNSFLAVCRTVGVLQALLAFLQEGGPVDAASGFLWPDPNLQKSLTLAGCFQNLRSSRIGLLEARLQPLSAESALRTGSEHLFL